MYSQYVIRQIALAESCTFSPKAQYFCHEEPKTRSEEIFLSFKSRLLPLKYCMKPPPPHPPGWQRKGICRHANEMRTSPARWAKRGNFWNDGCRPWCPIRFSSFEFTASAALCKQLGSKTGCSAISTSPFHFFFYARSAMSLREHNFRFLLRNNIVLCLLFGCPYCSFYLHIYQRWRSTMVVVNVYRRAFAPV